MRRRHEREQSGARAGDQPEGSAHPE
jgi:hypothetical protein